MHLRKKRKPGQPVRNIHTPTQNVTTCLIDDGWIVCEANSRTVIAALRQRGFKPYTPDVCDSDDGDPLLCIECLEPGAKMVTVRTFKPTDRPLMILNPPDDVPLCAGCLPMANIEPTEDDLINDANSDHDSFYSSGLWSNGHVIDFNDPPDDEPEPTEVPPAPDASPEPAAEDTDDEARPNTPAHDDEARTTDGAGPEDTDGDDPTRADDGGAGPTGDDDPNPADGTPDEAADEAADEVTPG